MAATDATGDDAPPSISVVIPVFNDPEGLAETLESLSVQTYPDDRHEVIVVDNGSTDDTPAVANRVCARHDHFTLTTESTVQGSYAARNRGIKNAAGSIIAFVDADMTVPADWLARVAAAMDGVDYLSCGVQLYSDGPESLAAKYDRLSGFDIERYIDDLDFAPTCCLVVRDAIFDEVGLFDSRLISSGDLEFGNRVVESGRSLEYRPDIRMYHPTRDTVGSIVGKAVRIGRGRYQLRRYYPERYGSPLALLVHPGGYLPPKPWQMDESFRHWETLTRLEKLAFYTLATVAGFAQLYGKFYEAIDGSLRRRVEAATPRADDGETLE